MFTGLVEATARVESLERRGDVARLVIEAPFAAELAVGDSVAVNGCCLTAVAEPEAPARRLVADVSPETLRCTTLGELTAGDVVNLERALRLADRLGGHLVQGHVDGVETVLEVRPEGDGQRHRVSVAAWALPFVVPKGSIAIDSVSLTVAALGPIWLEVALVPHTLEHSTLGRATAGTRVNVEHDLVGKYLLRSLGLAGRLELAPEARERLGLP